MTGEVSLTGRVLPIGGVKQKLLAAHRAGLTTILIPKRNEPDLEDVPESVLAELTVHPVSDVREVLDLALEPAQVDAHLVRRLTVVLIEGPDHPLDGVVRSLLFGRNLRRQCVLKRPKGLPDA